LPISPNIVYNMASRTDYGSWQGNYLQAVALVSTTWQLSRRRGSAGTCFQGGFDCLPRAGQRSPECGRLCQGWSSILPKLAVLTVSRMWRLSKINTRYVRYVAITSLVVSLKSSNIVVVCCYTLTTWQLCEGLKLLALHHRSKLS
jgi:hypothetical protein